MKEAVPGAKKKKCDSEPDSDQHVDQVLLHSGFGCLEPRSSPCDETRAHEHGKKKVAHSVSSGARWPRSSQSQCSIGRFVPFDW
jgi:hypothetical protein